VHPIDLRRDERGHARRRRGRQRLHRRFLRGTDRELPAARAVAAPGNVGYASGANLGIATTDAAVVAVLNSDLELKPGVAAAMLSALDADPRIGAVGPRVLNLDGSVYPSARSDPGLVVAMAHRVPRPRVAHQSVDPPLPASSTSTRRSPAMSTGSREPRSGCAVKHSTTSAAGTSGNFMYMEDFDLCLRLRRAGWRIEFVPGGEIVHVQGASTSKRPYRMIAEHHRSVWRFAARRYRGWRRPLLAPFAVVLTLRFFAAMAQHAWGRPNMPRVNRLASARMGKSSRQKRRTYQTPKKSRNGANMVWYVAAAVLIIGGVLGVALSRSKSATAVAPTTKDHWHIALGVKRLRHVGAGLGVAAREHECGARRRPRGSQQRWWDLRATAQPRGRPHPRRAGHERGGAVTTRPSAPTSSTAAGS